MKKMKSWLAAILSTAMVFSFTVAPGISAAAEEVDNAEGVEIEMYTEITEEENSDVVVASETTETPGTEDVIEESPGAEIYTETDAEGVSENVMDITEPGPVYSEETAGINGSNEDTSIGDADPEEGEPDAAEARTGEDEADDEEDEKDEEDEEDEEDDGILLLSVLESVPYVDASGASYTATDVTEVEDDVTTWSDGWYVVDSVVEISSRVTVSGTVNLILADECALTADSGIQVNSGNTLNIYGQSGGSGKLIATGSSNNAGIGGTYASSGSITINGGEITANGGSSGAGIGGGNYGNGGTITINGGIVNATGNENSAAIGGGYNSGSGNITITGGVITAEGGNWAAGIGGGIRGGATNVNITGGTIIATGKNGGAGIGNGPSYSGSSTIAIENCVIYASEITGLDASSHSGIIYVGSGDGPATVYDSPVFSSDVRIPAGKTAWIEEGKTVTIGSGATLANYGTLYQDWGSTFTKTGTYADNGSTYYQVVNSLAGLGQNISLSGVSTYSGNTYATESETVSLPSDYIYSDLTVTKNSSGTVSASEGSFTMPDEPVQLTGSVQKEITESMFTVDTDPEAYTGDAITKSIVGSDNGNTMSEDTDYTVYYEDNIHTGTARITITGEGNYTGTLDYEFTILQAAQYISYEETQVEKFDYDDPFTNELTKDLVYGEITYSFEIEMGEEPVIEINETTGEVTIKNPGVVSVTATASGSDDYKEAAASYILVVNSDEISVKIEVNNDEVGYDDDKEEYTDELTYDGEDLELEIVLGFDSDEEAHLTLNDITYQWYDYDPDTGTLRLIDGATGDTYTLTGDAVGAGDYVYLCVAVVIYDNGYEHTVYGVIEIKIDQADQIISYEEKELTKTTADDDFINPLTKDAFSGDDGAGITYLSSDPSVATVDETTGMVHIVSAGVATITATAAATDNYNEATASYELTVFSMLKSCDYVDASGAPYTAEDVIEAMDYFTTWSDGWYVVDSYLEISSRIEVSGTVNLILADGCTLTASRGIHVASGNTLNIYGQSGGTGELIATGYENYSAIGSGYPGGGSITTYGSITINGGVITANGGSYAAGIGSGLNGGSGGTITINGGVIEAKGGIEAAGIGGGRSGSGGTITINGGEVTATASSYGAGIGGGRSGSGGTITINGGEVTATASSYGAGIGGGELFDGGNITITGGEVTAIATGYQSGAAIGGGSSQIGSGTIKIQGGMVTATSASDGGAGIGGGYNGEGGTIEITGGTVVASGASGIGNGYKKSSGTTTTTIENCVIYANSITEFDASSCSGMIFVGDGDGPATVYGSPVFSTDVCIPEGKTAHIEEGKTVTIASGATLTIYGTVYQDWGSTFTKYGTYTDNGGTYYEVTSDIDGDSSSFTIGGPTEYSDRNYAAYGIPIQIVVSDGYVSKDLTVEKNSGGTVTAPDGRFLMPEDPVMITGTVDEIITITEDMFEVDTDPVTYTGSAITKAISGADGGSVLTEDTDYTVSYDSNINAGTATITIEGIGFYTGTLTYEFEIEKADQTLAFAEDSIKKGTLDEPFTNELTGAQGGVTYTSSNEDVATVDGNGMVTIVSFGEATITATAEETENYNGGATASYDITVTCDHLYSDEKDSDGNYMYITTDWSEDGSECTFTFACTVCGEKVEVDGNVTDEVTDPGCTTEGNDHFTADASIESADGTTVTAESEMDIAIPALGHDWEWSDEVVSEGDSTTTRVYFTCTHCGAEVEEDIIVETDSVGIEVHTDLNWNDVFSADDLAELFEQYSDGEEIDISLGIGALDEKEVPEEDARMIEDVVGQIWNNSDIFYMDISLILTVTHNDDVIVDEAVTETNLPVTFTVTIPDKLLNAEGNSYMVIRIHDGEAEILPTTDNGDGTLTFASEKFSTYAIAKGYMAYDMTVQVNGGEDISRTYDGSTIELTVETAIDPEVTGEVTYTYQWYLNGAKIEGADGSSLTLSGSAADSGTYSCFVTATLEDGTILMATADGITVTISKTAQSPAFSDGSNVTKTESDAPFTNPLTGAYGDVTYTSSDESVAIVDADGNVTIIGPGTATITAVIAGDENHEGTEISYTLTVTGDEGSGGSKRDEITEPGPVIQDGGSGTTGGTDGNTGTDGTGSTGANTADTNAPILYGILVALAGAAIVTLGVRRRVIRR